MTSRSGTPQVAAVAIRSASEDIVMIQPVDGKDLVHKFTVAGDDAGPQPVEQAFVGQLEPQRKQPAMTLLFFKQCAGKTVQPLRPEVEGEQSRIILFQDEFHCLHRFFYDSRLFPKGEHDTQTHNNILLQTVKFNSKTGHFPTMSPAHQPDTPQFVPCPFRNAAERGQFPKNDGQT